jgi:hypothetical protein
VNGVAIKSSAMVIADPSTATWTAHLFRLTLSSALLLIILPPFQGFNELLSADL